jgi:hypothetical protein
VDGAAGNVTCGPSSTLDAPPSALVQRESAPRGLRSAYIRICLERPVPAIAIRGEQGAEAPRQLKIVAVELRGLTVGSKHERVDVGEGIAARAALGLTCAGGGIVEFPSAPRQINRDQVVTADLGHAPRHEEGYEVPGDRHVCDVEVTLARARKLDLTSSTTTANVNAIGGSDSGAVSSSRIVTPPKRARIGQATWQARCVPFPPEL